MKVSIKAEAVFITGMISKVQAVPSCDGKSNLKYEQPSNNIYSLGHSADSKQLKSDSSV